MFINDKINEKFDKIEKYFNLCGGKYSFVKKDVLNVLNDMSDLIEELCKLYNSTFNNKIDYIKKYNVKDYLKYINLTYNLLQKSALSEYYLLSAFNLVIKGYIWEFSNIKIDKTCGNICSNYIKMLKFIFYELKEACHYHVIFNRNPDTTVQNLITIKRLGRYNITSDEDFILPQLQIPLIRQTIDKYLYDIFRITQLIEVDLENKKFAKCRIDFQNSKSINSLLFNAQEVNVLGEIYSWSCRFIHAGYKEKRWFIELCTKNLELIYHMHHDKIKNKRTLLFNEFNKIGNKRNIIVNFDSNFSFEYYLYAKKFKKLCLKYLDNTENIIYDYLNSINFNDVDNDTIDIINIMEKIVMTLCLLIYNISYFTKANIKTNVTVDMKILNIIKTINVDLEKDIINIPDINKKIKEISQSYQLLFSK